MMPDLHLPTTPPHSKPPTDKPSATKAKISRPRPISAISQTANIPAEMGGVGGPSTLRPLPNTMSERQKGKQKAQLPFPKTWRDNMLTPAAARKQRQGSDASFVCEGVGESSKYAPRKDAGPSNRFVYGERISEEDAKDFPSPLFSGTKKRGGGGGGEERDTRFYQPYVEVLEEYDEGGRF